MTEHSEATPQFGLSHDELLSRFVDITRDLRDTTKTADRDEFRKLMDMMVSSVTALIEVISQNNQTVSSQVIEYVEQRLQDGH